MTLTYQDIVIEKFRDVEVLKVYTDDYVVVTITGFGRVRDLTGE